MMTDIITELKKPFQPEHVKWRVSRAGVARSGKPWVRVLAYVDARVVMDRLDRVVGAENWERSHDFGPNGEVLCTVKINLYGQWIAKTDGAAQTNIAGEKGGLSDAFKRACVSFGIGRYLYQLEEDFAEVQPEKPKSQDKWNYLYIDGKNDKSGDGQKVWWQPPPLPNWALPGAEPQEAKYKWAKRINAKIQENQEKREERANMVKSRLQEQGVDGLRALKISELKTLYNDVAGI